MNMKQFSLAVSAAVAMAIGIVSAAEYAVGYREIKGISVPAGSTTTQSDAITVISDGEFVKNGAGKLTMPIKAVNQRVDATVKVLDGTLELTNGDAPEEPVRIPSVVRDDAAIWLDATNPGEGMVTNGVDETADVQYLTRWCDRREENPSSPTMYYFEPEWVNHESSPLWGVPPVLQTAEQNKMGRTTVYFGGAGSSQKMHLYKGGKQQDAITGVYEYFIVFGVDQYLGSIIGRRSEANDPFFNTIFPAKWSTYHTSNLFYRRGEVGPSGYTGRHYLDGVRFDAYKTGVKRGFQLLDSQRWIQPCQFAEIMNGYAQDDTHKCEGGDFISEIIIFTRVISEEERLAVQRYLMNKWDLPHRCYERGQACTDYSGMQRGYTTYATSTNATLEVNVDAGEVTKAIKLSGEGKVVKKGAGAMEIGPAAAVPFNGRFELQEGTLRLRGGLPPALDLTAGQTLTSQEKNFSDETNPDTFAYQSESMTEISVANNAGSTTVVKDGPGPARIRSIAEGVSRLRVKAGQCVIDAGVKQHSVRASKNATVISANIPNPGFEQTFSHNQSGAYNNMGTLSGNLALGWQGLVNASSVGYLTCATNADTTCTYGTWCSYPPPEGTNVLYLTGRVGAWSTITFPVDGYYQLSLKASSRDRSDNYRILTCEVFIGESFSTTNTMGVFEINKAPYRQFHCKTPFVKAGRNYVFGFIARQYKLSYDATLNIDDVHMELIPDEERLPTAYVIPNGDFEHYSSNVNVKAITPLHELTGWTVYADTIKDRLVGGLVREMSEIGSGRAFTAADVKWNSTQLLLGGHSSATTTFTPPAGTYRLRGKLADWPIYGCNQPNAYIKATITIDGEEKSLEDVTVNRHCLNTYIWPVKFTVDGKTPVTLKLEQNRNLSGEYKYAAILDDLDLIAGDTWVEDEILKDTEVEGLVSNGWTGLNPAAEKYYEGSVTNVSQGGELRVIDGDRKSGDSYVPYEHNWGHARFQGRKYMWIIQNGGMQQQVTMPIAGNYRLTYHERSRPDANNGGNPVQVWIRNSTGSYTNFIARSTRYFATNYVEYAYNFSVPGKDTYYLAFQGTGWKWNATLPNQDLEENIDGVSLKYIPDELNETPSIPSDLRIYVEEDAILNLNFPGTVTTGPVKLGGVTVTGEVSAKKYPNYITGSGKLNAVAGGGDGMILLVK